MRYLHEWFCCEPNKELDDARSEAASNNENTCKIVKIIIFTILYVFLLLILEWYF